MVLLFLALSLKKETHILPHYKHNAYTSSLSCMTFFYQPAEILRSFKFSKDCLRAYGKAFEAHLYGDFSNSHFDIIYELLIYFLFRFD